MTSLSSTNKQETALAASGCGVSDVDRTSLRQEHVVEKAPPLTAEKKVPQKHTPSDPLPLRAHPLNCAQLPIRNGSTKTETARKTFSKTEIM